MKSKSSQLKSKLGNPKSKSSNDEQESLESVSGRKVLTGIPEVNTVQKQFPISGKKSRAHSARKKKEKEDLLTTGPPNLYGNWRNFFLDKHQLEARLINKYRVQGKKDGPCYIYDEMHRYDNNCFYRNAIIGSTLGAIIYFITLVFVILPETNEKFDLFKNANMSTVFIPTVLATIIVCFTVRLAATLYLSGYLIKVIQLAILTLAVLGNVHNECRRGAEFVDGANQTLASLRASSVPKTGAGQVPLFAMAMVEDGFDMEPDPLRKSLVLARCDQSLKKYCAINLLSELINFFLAVRLMLL